MKIKNIYSENFLFRVSTLRFPWIIVQPNCPDTVLATHSSSDITKVCRNRALPFPLQHYMGQQNDDKISIIAFFIYKLPTVWNG